MPELALSVKGLSEIISAGSKAFNDLYSTLRRIGLDGWAVGDEIVRGVRNKKQEARIRTLILLFRNLQVDKLAAASKITEYMYHSSEERWDHLGETLKVLFTRTKEVIDTLKKNDFEEEAIYLGSAYPIVIEGLNLPYSLVFSFTEPAPTRNHEFDDLVTLQTVLENESMLIGKCADILTEHLISFRERYMK